MTRTSIVPCGVAMALGSWAIAADPFTPRDVPLELLTAPLSLTQIPQDAPEPFAQPSSSPEPAPVFGQEGSAWLTLGGGVASTFGDDTGVNLHAAYGTFLAQDVEFSLEGGGWFFAQDGKDAVGANLSLVFRWHFYDDGDWTFYVDGGAGVLAASRPVPQGGTSFDLTPRLGVGLTKLLDDDGLRLQAGLRWHHISNARILGDERNVGLDAPMLYVGVIMPL